MAEKLKNYAVIICLFILFLILPVRVYAQENPAEVSGKVYIKVYRSFQGYSCSEIYLSDLWQTEKLYPQEVTENGLYMLDIAEAAEKDCGYLYIEGHYHPVYFYYDPSVDHSYDNVLSEEGYVRNYSKLNVVTTPVLSEVTEDSGYFVYPSEEHPNILSFKVDLSDPAGIFAKSEIYPYPANSSSDGQNRYYVFFVDAVQFYDAAGTELLHECSIFPYKEEYDDSGNFMIQSGIYYETQEPLYVPEALDIYFQYSLIL